MSIISNKFSELKKRKKKALIVFLTAGDPSLKKNAELVDAFEKDGVDFVELGVPFSDPLADGPVIQASSFRSLRRGTSLKKILTLAQKIRRRSRMPILLMTYLNPIYHYGLARFADRAKASGVAGLVIPDLPPEEGSEISSIFRKRGLDLVYLMAPTSTPERVRAIAQSSRGFIYYVSLTGVTGARFDSSRAVHPNIRLAKSRSRLPVCVGFGISTPRQAQAISRVADGVIVGSAVVRALADHPSLGAAEFSRRFVRPFAKALGKVR